MKQRIQITFETEETIRIRRPSADEKRPCPECRRMIEAERVSPIATADLSLEQMPDTQDCYAVAQRTAPVSGENSKLLKE